MELLIQLLSGFCVMLIVMVHFSSLYLLHICNVCSPVGLD